jgi:predicted kinase
MRSRRTLIRRLAAFCASVVLDFGLWARIERDEMRSAARGLGVGVELHDLDAPADELRRRIEARNSEPPWDSYPIRRADLDGRLRVFQAPDAAELAFVRPSANLKLSHYRPPQRRPLSRSHLQNAPH